MKKILFVAVLIFCLLTTTQTAYAYFDDDRTTVLEASEQLYSLQPQLVNQGEFLIPLGSVLGEDDTYYYIFQYEAIIEDGVTLDSDLANVVWENSSFSEEELNELFNFDIQIDHLGDTSFSKGLLYERTEGEIVEITITVSMNNIDLLYNSNTTFGQELSFDYLLTVSKALD